MLNWLLRRRARLTAELEKAQGPAAPAAPAAPARSADELMREAFPMHERGDAAGAERLYRQILEVDPDYADAHYLLGRIAQDRGLLDDAQRHVQQAVRCNAREPSFLRTLGQIHYARGHFQEAVARLEAALELDPNADCHTDLGCAYEKLGRFAEATREFEKAVELAPDSPLALNNYANSLKDRGRVEEAIPVFRKAKTLMPANHDLFSNYLYCLNYSSTLSREEVFREHLGFDQAHGSGRWGPPSRAPNDPDPERRLRIAYFSPDFRSHPVHLFVEPLLRHHDRARFEVWCYSLWPWRDATTDKLQRLADGWVDCGDWTDTQIAQRIAADGIDVLIEMAGHTGGNRLPALGPKPAPVIATWLGYPNTTGLKAVDYRITDAVCDPEGATERYHSETLVRLPGAQWCYVKPEFDAPPQPLPAAASGRIRFGSFNHASKVNDGTLALWAQVLARVPDARLVLWGITDEHRERIGRALAGHGVAVERVDYVGRTPLPQQLELYRQVDIALDTHPYSGVTTTFNSLWMGVPVLTLTGEGLAARSSASILQRLGLQDWVTQSPQDYVEAAARHAADLAGLAGLREALRGRIEGSELMDAGAFARKFEQACREMWRARCRSA